MFTQEWAIIRLVDYIFKRKLWTKNCIMKTEAKNEDEQYMNEVRIFWLKYVSNIG